MDRSIHSYPWKCCRDPESEENVKIKIIVSICEDAKKHKRPYTERLLPDFLVPYGVIRSDKVLEVEDKSEGDAELDEVCSILGCTGIKSIIHLKHQKIYS